MAYQDKKVMILFSLYLGLASISLYKIFYSFAEVYYLKQLGIFMIVGTIVVFPIAIFFLFVASYAIIKNKWDPKYIGLVASLFLTLFFIVDFITYIGAFGWNLQFFTGRMYIIFFSIVTLFVNLLFWKRINEKEIKLPFFQNKATQSLFPCYIAIASISSLSIFSMVSQILIHEKVYFYIALVLYIFATIILIFSSKGLLENKKNIKFLALTGVLLFLVALLINIYYKIFVVNDIFGYHINRFLMIVFTTIVIILNIYYWKIN